MSSSVLSSFEFKLVVEQLCYVQSVLNEMVFVIKNYVIHFKTNGTCILYLLENYILKIILIAKMVT